MCSFLAGTVGLCSNYYLLQESICDKPENEDIYVLLQFTSPSVRNYAKIMGLSLALFFETITVILSYMTYKKFGWRVYSKLACDLRVKNAEERRNLYFKFHRFRTFVKLDLQVKKSDMSNHAAL